ncbi:pyridoxamine 5'-phosphate oxidase family protein [Mycobacterium xenopi 4042]|uniref:Pyridoxamine 5'-phosphate oxidase family protein n=1 Tax=Mycobacterium xenopi 4042 TaxID=1299334 RepID=X8E5T5_MYCXE|nr:pyridoxamine 5'-phosphate oxidase family protein [Mycobacterium xenopi 4042]
MPITLPVWFVIDDRTIAMMTPARTKKIARVRHDPRASFLVESGNAGPTCAASISPVVWRLSTMAR